MDLNEATTAPPELTQDSILREVWEKLTLGAEPAGSDYHVMAVATVDEMGMPQVRNVVLRQATAVERLLVFHTDRRSPKFRELTANPRAALLFYSRKDKVQIRLQVETRLAGTGDDRVRAVYQSMPPRCQRVYLAPEAPGTPSPQATGNLPDEFLDRTPQQSEAAEGLANFVAVECRVHRIDWLSLAATGHRRACFTWNGADFEGAWTNP
jgi:hypothetical protein